VAFCCDNNRAKYYVTNQGCDEVAVFDANSNLLMRYYSVGNNNSIESPHNLKVSPDRRYVYTLLRFGNVLQKHDARNDQHIADCFIDNADWNVIVFAKSGNVGIISDLSPSGKIRIVDLNNMTVIKSLQGLINPHGLYFSDKNNTLYVTSQYGNAYYKIKFDTSDFNVIDFETRSLQPGVNINFNPGSIDPHEILFSPDESKYFVTCQASNEVRVFLTSNDSLLAVIPVGTFPLEMAISYQYPYLAVTCEETPSSFPRTKGSVSVINYNTLQLVGTINQTLFQPHGIAIDDDRNLIIVTNRNLTNDGPAPHHSSECGARNGFISYYRLSDLTPLPKMKTEVSVDPYSISIRP
jgi:DNA-binding beta-propeller fold protein YncE